MTPAFVLSSGGFAGCKIGGARTRFGNRHGVQMCDAVKTEKPEPAPSGPKPAKWVPIKKVKSTASWAYSCVDAFPVKGSGSKLNIDLRPASERGAEAGICPTCNGTKTVVCMLCNGTPYYINGKEIECPACQGDVMVECADCHGTGKQVELTPGWWEEGGIVGLYETQSMFPKW